MNVYNLDTLAVKIFRRVNYDLFHKLVNQFRCQRLQLGDFLDFSDKLLQIYYFIRFRILLPKAVPR